MGCCASCGESEFGGRSAKFYRHPTYPAFCSITSLRAPCSLPKLRSSNYIEVSTVSLVLDDLFLYLFPAGFVFTSVIGVPAVGKVRPDVAVSVLYALCISEI